MVSEGRPGARQGTGGGSPFQSGNAGCRRSTHGWPANIRKPWRPRSDTEILEKLKTAVVSFRHSLELQPDSAQAAPRHRAGAAVDQVLQRQVASARSRETAPGNKPAGIPRIPDRDAKSIARIGQGAAWTTSPSDAFAEPKRLQDELAEEIPPLKEKIKAELQPQQSGPSAKAAQGSSSELEQGIALLAGLGRGSR